MISVIVPVYNTPAPLLQQCLDSVRGQSHTDWELIIVDDGSAPATARWLDDYAAGDGRIKVMHRPNGGMSVARNTGIDHARGSHALFIDSDDTIHPYALAIFDDIARRGADMVVGRFKVGDSIVYNLNADASGHFTPYETLMAAMLYQQGIYASVWNVLYDINLLREHRFTEGILYEDLDYFYRIADDAKRIYVLDAVLYFYRMTPGSIMHRWDERRFDVLDVVDRLEDFMARHHPAIADAAADRKLSANFNMYLLACRHGYREQARRCWDVICRYRARAIKDRNVRLKNKAAALISYTGPKIFALLNRWAGE